MPDAPSDDAPNVVVIYTDDQDPDWVGAYGGDALTPNIDRLAEEGVRFDRYYATSPVCSPSRYSALTGRYASRSDLFQEEFPPGGPVNIGWEPGIRGERPNLASVLSENGYTTGLVGKFHQGIDGEEFEPVDPDADPTDPEVEARLERNYQTVVDIVESCGFDEARSVYEGNVNGMELPEEFKHQNQDWVTRGAVEFIEDNHEDPFFLFMAPTLTHSPRGESQLRSDPRATPRGYLEEAPDVQPSRESVIERAREFDAPLDVTWVDDGVGAVLDALEEHGVAEDTLVVFTSDHGDIEGKFSTYDRGARQPCLARLPGHTDSRGPCEDLVSNVDLAPTIFDLAGIEPPADYQVDGQSFLPCLTGEGSYERESVFLEITTERAVVTDDNYKYIAVRYPPEIQERVDAGERFNYWCVRYDGDVHHTYGADEYYPAYFEADQLYDLDADPEEQHNLAGDPEQADRLERMQGLLAAYSADLPHAFGEFTDGSEPATSRQDE
ncbi:MAG: sulfatase [Halobacteriales archaeon]